MVQTGSSLLLKLTMTKLVHTGSCAWQANTYLWRKMVEIGSSFLFKYNLMLTTWLAVTSSIWSSLCYTVALTSSNWFLLVVVHDKQIHIYGGSVFSTTSKESPSALKSFMADQAGLNMTDVKQKLIQRHVVRELPPLQRVLIQHNCECEECEGSWSWVQKAYSSNTNKTATNPASNRRIQHGKHQKESIGLHHSWYRFLADPIHSHAVPSPTPPPVAAAHMQGKKSLSLILTPNGYGCGWNWLWLAQTGSSWFKLVWMSREDVETGSSLLLKLVVTSSNWLLKPILPGSNWFSLVVNVKRRWFKLAMNWFFLVVETGCDYLKLVVETGCD